MSPFDQVIHINFLNLLEHPPISFFILITKQMAQKDVAYKNSKVI